MRLFRRLQTTPAGKPPHGGALPPPEPEAPVAAEPAEPAISATRTLVKSEPELLELVSSEPRLEADGVEVSLGEKGFGTRVAITARRSAGLTEADLESLLDQLAEPQKRPFTNS
jgi:hypothetical protein